jgi:hypothetical protein
VRMGWSELESDGLWGEPLAPWHYPPWLPGLIGGIEVAAGAALIIPWLWLRVGGRAARAQRGDAEA